MPLTEVTVPNIIKEVQGTGKVSFTKAGVTGTRVYSIPWKDSTTGLSWLQQVALFFGDPSTSPPTLPDPFSPDLSFIRVLECSVEPVESEPTGVDKFGKATFARVLASFSYGNLDISETLSLSADVTTSPGSNYGWAGAVGAPGVYPLFPKAPETLQEDVGAIRPKGEYVFERHQLLAPNFRTMIDLIGCVNKYPFLGFHEDEFLLAGIDGQRTWLPTGVRTWDLRFHGLLAVASNGGHNALYRADKAAWWYLGTKATNIYGNHDFIYRQEDLSPLLQFY